MREVYGFPDSSVGKESTCNAGDPGLIPGWGRSTGEGIGYPLQYSWASLVAQLVKNSLQCWRPGFDPWVGKISPEGRGYPLQYSGLENSMDCIVHGVAKGQTWLSDFHFTSSGLRGNTIPVPSLFSLSQGSPPSPRTLRLSPFFLPVHISWPRFKTLGGSLGPPQ